MHGNCRPQLAELVFPSFLPDEILVDEVFQWHAADEVIQPPPSSNMTDDQHPLSLPAQRQIAKEAANARHGLPPAFSAWIGLVQMLAAGCLQLGHRHSVVLPVVTFP